jgi:hypothetical protein
VTSGTIRSVSVVARSLARNWILARAEGCLLAAALHCIALQLGAAILLEDLAHLDESAPELGELVEGGECCNTPTCLPL